MMESETQKFLRTSLHEALNRMSPGDFTPVKRLEDIVNDAYFESRHWMREIFGEARDPDADTFEVRHSYFIWRGGAKGFDMLRHQYELDSRAVTVTESVGIIDVAVRLGAADDTHMEAAERASRVANWLLRLPASVHFTQDGSDGWLVSNRENVGKAIEDWKERIDARVDGHTVQLFIYKEDPNSRPKVRNFSVWFDADFRKNPPGAAR
jgi:hypothetical protein